MTEENSFDVIIIGGSYAGLSAAMTLGRSLRRVLIIDSGLPCNRQTPHSHNFITQDGETPAAISAKALAQVLRYPTVSLYNDIAIDAQASLSGFIVHTASGKKYPTRKLVFATGIKDLFPTIKGFDECWGISVIHCPYCHGYEVRKQNTGIIANGHFAYHYAQLLRHLAADLTIFTNGKADFTNEQTATFSKHNITVVEKEITQLTHHNGNLKQIVFADQTVFPLKVIYARPAFEQHCKIPEALGCVVTEQGYLKIDMLQKTNVANVFACGDNTNPMRSVANAVATGNMAGAGVNSELTAEEF